MRQLSSHGILCSGIGSANAALTTHCNSTLEFAIDNHHIAIEGFTANFGSDKIMYANVEDIDYTSLPDVDFLLAAPPQLFNEKMFGDENFKNIASSVVDYTMKHKPKVVCVISNDKYAASEYGKYILESLYVNGYDPHVHILRAADYAVPSTRRYSVITMTNIQMALDIPKRRATRGWFSALNDIADTFPPYELTPILWQKVIKSVSTSHEHRFPVIVRGNNECQPYNEKEVPLQYPHMRCHGGIDGGAYRNHLWVHDTMEVGEFTPRAYARINTIPDSMIIPELNGKYNMCRLITDVVPYNMMVSVHTAISQSYDFHTKEK